MSRVLFRGICYLSILLLFTSCTTKRPALQAVQPLVNVDQEGLAATLSFRDDASLTREFGSETNPFRTEYAKLQFRRRLVFDLSLENRSPEEYRFRLADCELQYGGKTVGATNSFQLINEWRMMDSSPKMAAQKEPIIKKTMVPAEKLVPAGSSLRGLLLFQGNLPAHGPARIIIGGVAEGLPLQFDFEF